MTYFSENQAFSEALSYIISLDTDQARIKILKHIIRVIASSGIFTQAQETTARILGYHRTWVNPCVSNLVRFGVLIKKEMGYAPIFEDGTWKARQLPNHYSLNPKLFTTENYTYIMSLLFPAKKISTEHRPDQSTVLILNDCDYITDTAVRARALGSFSTKKENVMNNELLLHDCTKNITTKIWKITVAGRIKLQPFTASIIMGVIQSTQWQQSDQHWRTLITLIKERQHEHGIGYDLSIERAYRTQFGIAVADRYINYLTPREQYKDLPLVKPSCDYCPHQHSTDKHIDPSRYIQRIVNGRPELILKDETPMVSTQTTGPSQQDVRQMFTQLARMMKR